MPKFRLREVVRVNGISYTVEQIAEELQTEPRYWLQQGKDYASRAWKRESEIEDTGVRTLAGALFQREQAASRIRTTLKEFYGKVPDFFEPAKNDQPIDRRAGGPLPVM